MLFFDNSTQILHLWHSQAPANSGESSAQIWHLSSRDKGGSWTKSVRRQLPPTSPFCSLARSLCCWDEPWGEKKNIYYTSEGLELNLIGVRACTTHVTHAHCQAPYFTAAGDFPRNRIIRRSDGTILFPYYSQGKGHPNWSVMGVSKNSSVGGPTDWAMHTVANSANLVQPSVVSTRETTVCPFSPYACCFADAPPSSPPPSCSLALSLPRPLPPSFGILFPFSFPLSFFPSLSTTFLRLSYFPSKWRAASIYACGSTRRTTTSGAFRGTSRTTRTLT